MAYYWELFTIFGALLLWNGYTLVRPGERLLRFLVSFIFWIGSLSVWIGDNPGGSIIPILVIMVPLLMSMVYGLQALGQYTGEPPFKKTPYDD